MRLLIIWFRSFDFIEDFFIRKKEDSSDDIYELVLKIKSLEEENYYKKKLIVGIKEVKNELLKELCDFVYYYTKIKKDSVKGHAFYVSKVTEDKKSKYQSG